MMATMLTPNPKNDNRKTSPWGLIFIWTVASTVLLASLCMALWLLTQAKAFQAELAITVVIVVLVVILLIGLAVTAMIFRRLGLATQRHAMGLPEGSIRAIIALMLIVIFAVVAIFLITNVDYQSRGGRVQNLTPEQAAAYAPGDYVSRNSFINSDGEERVTLQLARNDPASMELSQQLLTTLGTLVVAVASFYFGSQSTLAKPAKPENGSPERTSDQTGPPVVTSEGMSSPVGSAHDAPLADAVNADAAKEKRTESHPSNANPPARENTTGIANPPKEMRAGESEGLTWP